MNTGENKLEINIFERRKFGNVSATRLERTIRTTEGMPSGQTHLTQMVGSKSEQLRPGNLAW